MVCGNIPSRQIVYSVKGQIHYDQTLGKIIENDKVIFCDYEKDLILFYIKDYTDPKKKLAHIQISPRNKVNMYVEDSLPASKFDYIEKLLHELIIGVSNSKVELEPITTLESKNKPDPKWFTNIIWRIPTPMRINPKKFQIITSTFKKRKKSEKST